MENCKLSVDLVLRVVSVDKVFRVVLIDDSWTSMQQFLAVQLGLKHRVQLFLEKLNFTFTISRQFLSVLLPNLAHLRLRKPTASRSQLSLAAALSQNLWLFNLLILPQCLSCTELVIIKLFHQHWFFLDDIHVLLGIFIHSPHLLIDCFRVKLRKGVTCSLLDVLHVVLEDLTSEAIDILDQSIMPSHFVKLHLGSILKILVLTVTVLLLHFEHLAVRWRVTIQLKGKLLKVHAFYYNRWRSRP
jgi:hypothetical protein